MGIALVFNQHQWQTQLAETYHAIIKRERENDVKIQREEVRGWI